MENEIEYKGYTIKIVNDEHAESPDNWGNDDCFLVYDHRQFYVERKGFSPDDIYQHITERKVSFYEGYYVFPVYAYIHSGVALSLGHSGYPFNCRWDTSMKGFALVKRTKGWSYTKDKAYKIAQSVLDEWNDYLSGNVYGFEVIDPETEDVIDSCWGFYGDPEDSDLINQAKGTIDYEVGKKLQSHLSKLKTWIKSKVGINYRTPLTIAN